MFPNGCVKLESASVVPPPGGRSMTISMRARATPITTFHRAAHSLPVAMDLMAGQNVDSQR
jgi:hypothetical protein